MLRTLYPRADISNAVSISDNGAAPSNRPFFTPALVGKTGSAENFGANREPITIPSHAG
jgi:hypothetical protein